MAREGGGVPCRHCRGAALTFGLGRAPAVRTLLASPASTASAAFSRAETAALGALLEYIQLTQVGRMPHLRPPRRRIPAAWPADRCRHPRQPRTHPHAFRRTAGKPARHHRPHGHGERAAATLAARSASRWPIPAIAARLDERRGLRHGGCHARGNVRDALRGDAGYGTGPGAAHGQPRRSARPRHDIAMACWRAQPSGQRSRDIMASPAISVACNSNFCGGGRSRLRRATWRSSWNSRVRWRTSCPMLAARRRLHRGRAIFPTSTAAAAARRHAAGDRGLAGALCRDDRRARTPHQAQQHPRLLHRGECPAGRGAAVAGAAAPNSSTARPWRAPCAFHHGTGMDLEQRIAGAGGAGAGHRTRRLRGFV